MGHTCLIESCPVPHPGQLSSTACRTHHQQGRDRMTDHARNPRPARGGALTHAEIEAEMAEALPERAAMSTMSVYSLDAATGSLEAVGDGVADTAAATTRVPADPVRGHRGGRRTDGHRCRGDRADRRTVDPAAEELMATTGEPVDTATDEVITTAAPVDPAAEDHAATTGEPVATATDDVAAPTAESTAAPAGAPRPGRSARATRRERAVGVGRPSGPGAPRTAPPAVLPPRTRRSSDADAGRRRRGRAAMPVPTDGTTEPVAEAIATDDAAGRLHADRRRGDRRSPRTTRS